MLITVAALIPLTLNGIGELRGLPSDGPIPAAFKLLWARVVEPNALPGEKGHVFLWLEELDADNYPSGIPRAYQLPHDPDLVRKTEAALVKIGRGKRCRARFPRCRPPMRAPPMNWRWRWPRGQEPAPRIPVPSAKGSMISMQEC